MVAPVVPVPSIVTSTSQAKNNSQSSAQPLRNLCVLRVLCGQGRAVALPWSPTRNQRWHMAASGFDCVTKLKSSHESQLASARGCRFSAVLHPESVMRVGIGTAALAFLLAGTKAGAQQPPAATEVGAAQLALVNLPAKAAAKLTVTSPAFAPGADIPFENTQYRGNVFPGLAWSAGPEGTKSYVVIMQDADIL